MESGVFSGAPSDSPDFVQPVLSLSKGFIRATT